MFSVCEENINPPGLIWLNSEGHIYLRLFWKEISNNCFWGLFLVLK